MKHAGRSDSKAVVLLSGGMDSSTLLFFLRKQLRIRSVHALSFRYGQKHERELEMAKWQARKVGVAEHKVIDLAVLAPLVEGASALTDPGIAVPDLSSLNAKQRRQPPTYVPNRNMILLSLAAAYAEAHGITNIFYGAQAQDAYGYWDCTAEFVGRINSLLALNRGKPVRIHAPFAGMSKTAIVAIGRKLGVDYSRTWSCYRGGAEPCGSCPSCVERHKAMQETRA